MINVLGETYYVDLDLVEEYIGIPNNEVSMSGETSEMKINIIKFVFLLLYFPQKYYNLINENSKYACLMWPN